MWIIVRLIVLVIGFYIRYLNLFRKRFSFTDRSSSNAQYGVIRSTHKGRLVAYYLGVPLETNTIFEITREKDSNKILKRWGLSAEIQTGDGQFDEQYYIGSDHVHFNQVLRADPVVRKLIHDIISTHSSLESIICDGHSLYIHSKLIEIPADAVADKLHKLADKIRPIASTSKLQSYKDPFILKLLVFESMLFALIFYAVESFFEHNIVDRYSLDSPYEAFIPGTLTGLIIVGLLVVIFFKFFKESARSHFILTGNLVILLCGSPFWGTKTFIDLNHALDKSPLIVEKVVLNRREVQEHRGSKGRRYYSYHWYYRPAGSPETFPEQSVTLPRNVFESADDGDQVVLTSRKGAFNYPYRVSINNFNMLSEL